MTSLSTEKKWHRKDSSLIQLVSRSSYTKSNVYAAHVGRVSVCPSVSSIVTKKPCGSGTMRQSERFGEEKNVLPIPGFETWTVKPVA